MNKAVLILTCYQHRFIHITNNVVKTKSRHKVKQF